MVETHVCKSAQQYIQRGSSLFVSTNLFTFIPTKLPFIQAAGNVQKVQQKDLLQILNWLTITEMGNLTAVILNHY